MHVYTPPGYETSDAKYPVFYSLHGGGDEDSVCGSTIGRAGFILDNLIAANKAVPMIVVMPNGSLPWPQDMPARPAPGEAHSAEFRHAMEKMQKRFTDEWCGRRSSRPSRRHTASAPRTGPWPASRWTAARPGTCSSHTPRSLPIWGSGNRRHFRRQRRALGEAKRGVPRREGQGQWLSSVWRSSLATGTSQPLFQLPSRLSRH